MRLGEFLRDERIKKGIDLETAAEETRIKDVYIRALEDENWDMIPGEIYQRHYLKTYLEYLGHEDLYFRMSRERTEPGPVAEKMVRKPADEAWDSSRYLRIIVRLAVLVLVVSLLVWGGTKLFAGGEKKPKAEETSEVEVLDIPIAVPKPPDEVESQIIQAFGPGDTVGDVGSQIKSGFDTHTLKIEATEECWLTVSGPDGSLYKGLLKSGDVKTFGPAKHFNVSLGKPQGALVYFDDELIYGGGKGIPSSLTFSLPADAGITPKKASPSPDKVPKDGG